MTIAPLEPLTLRPPEPVAESVQTMNDANLTVVSAAADAKLDRTFARGIAWLGSVKWIVQLLTWGTTIVVARILTPEDYGLLTMGAVLLAFITLLSESGLGITVVTVREVTEEQISQINGAAILLGLVSFVAGSLVAFPVSWFYRAAALPPVIAVLSFTLVISAFRVVPGALLQRDLEIALRARVVRPQLQRLDVIADRIFVRLRLQRAVAAIEEAVGTQ